MDEKALAGLVSDTVCLSVCLSVCLPGCVCLSVCLFVCLSVYLCLSVCLSFCLSLAQFDNGVFLLVDGLMPVCLLVCLSVCMLVCLSLCLLVFVYVANNKSISHLVPASTIHWMKRLSLIWCLSVFMSIYPMFAFACQLQGIRIYIFQFVHRLFIGWNSLSVCFCLCVCCKESEYIYIEYIYIFHALIIHRMKKQRLADVCLSPTSLSLSKLWYQVYICLH